MVFTSPVISLFLPVDTLQGHYRFCDALFYLGAREKALEANLTAQSYCSADPEGMRDLQQQWSRFMTEISEGSSKGRAAACSEGDQALLFLVYGFTEVKNNLCN